MLALLVVLIITLMIIPLPTPAVDALLATNLGMSATLLMIALYVPNALAFSTFPSLLLFTTLFRVALSITVTRLILLHADAGDIILTFGQFVVGGNFVVGAVIFLIITIVQFVVITKGAERVAEVAARFTLDAMPGKQMSIDADMRAGTIDADQARQRRSLVEKENQLYGAMDGAMKFVKGDAIAGLIITAINIIGGLTIGVIQKGMTIDKALKTYSILTIGDGLVCQIPALLVAITAGVIVTRVSSDEGSALGKDIGGQLLSQPKALLLGGGLLLLFAVIPGFPKIQFITLGLGALAVGFVLNQPLFMRKKGEKKRGGKGFESSVAGKGKGAKKQGEDEFAVAVPLMVDIDARVGEALSHEALNEELIKIRKALYYDLGVPFPGIHLRFNEKRTNGQYQLLLQEVPISQGQLNPGHVLARERPENLDIQGIPYEVGEKFIPDTDTVWVDEKYVDILNKAIIPFFDNPQVLTYHISFVLKKYAGEFIGLQEAKFLLDNIEGQYPELIKEVMRVLPLQKITDIMQRLVQEDICIRNLRAIAQALIDWGQKEKDTILLTEYVRCSLKRYISYKYSLGQNMLTAYLLEPEVEEAIRKSIRQTSGGSYLALSPEISSKLIKNIKKQVGDLNQIQHKPVLLTAMDIRRYLRKLIELEFTDLPVLSYQELTEEITIQPLGRISLS